MYKLEFSFPGWRHHLCSNGNLHMVNVVNLFSDWETTHCINPQWRQSSFVGLVLHKVITTNAFKIVVYSHHPFPSRGYYGCERSGHPVLVSPVTERWGEAVWAGDHPLVCLLWVLPDCRYSVPGFVFRAPQPMKEVVCPHGFPLIFPLTTSKCS